MSEEVLLVLAEFYKHIRAAAQHGEALDIETAWKKLRSEPYGCSQRGHRIALAAVLMNVSFYVLLCCCVRVADTAMLGAR